MTADAWNRLRTHTSARIALGRSGGSIPTAARLDFQLSHARARDAVRSEFDAEAFAGRLANIGCQVLAVHSAARDRGEYLRRPDLGRRLSSNSRHLLEEFSVMSDSSAFDLVVIVTDGLSARAIEANAAPLISAFIKNVSSSGWSLGPIIAASLGRVALQDEIGELLRARVTLMLIGERPGLGTAESLGAYFTYSPRIGRRDAERNCISNVHSGGLSPEAAAEKLHLLITKAFSLQLSGVALKDDTEKSLIPSPPSVGLPKSD
jgi:ethanolamine ammonia-lyase small subunit